MVSNLSSLGLFPHPAPAAHINRAASAQKLANAQVKALASGLFLRSFGFWFWLTNPYFKFLIGRAQLARVAGETWALGFYNQQALKASHTAIRALYQAVSSGAAVVFVSDLKTYHGAQLFKLNHLLNRGASSLATLQYADVRYYYHDWQKTHLPKTAAGRFDLAVVCTDTPEYLSPQALRQASSFVLGTVDFQTRPDFFDYCLPPVKGSAQAMQLIIDVSTIAYMLREV
jgi:hypothetical protein